MLSYNQKEQDNTTNQVQERKKIMKFRVYHADNKYFPTYFRTKKEAVAFQNTCGGEIQRKIGGNWVGY